MDGNYRRDGLEKWAAQLQGIRNMFGPSWLVRARPGDLEAAAQRAKLEAKPPQLKRVLWAGQLCDVLEETESEVRIGFTNAAGLCTKLWLSRSANLYKVRED
jgi:hypothetical protein